MLVAVVVVAVVDVDVAVVDVRRGLLVVVGDCVPGTRHDEMEGYDSGPMATRSWAR